MFDGRQRADKGDQLSNPRARTSSPFDFSDTDFHELALGKVLGKGGFGTVSEIRAFSAEEQSQPVADLKRPSFVKAYSSRSAFKNVADKEVTHGEVESRKFIAKHCLRNGGDARYAVKVLSPETTKDPRKHCQGNSCVDLG